MNRLPRFSSAPPLVLALLLACQGAPAAPRSEPLPATSAPARAAAEPGPPRPPAEGSAGVHVRAEGQLGPGKNTLFVDIAPPAGAKLTPDSPLSLRGSGGIGLSFPSRLSGPLASHGMPLRLPIDVADGATGPAQLELSYYWCTDGNDAACQREQARLSVELDLSGSSAGGEAHVSYRPGGSKS